MGVNELNKESRLTDEQISTTFRKALKNEWLITEDDTTLLFYDLSYLTDRIKTLVSAFPDTTLHAIAIKANPLVNILSHIKDVGVGFEVATLPELHLAINSGVTPDKIVFDSPVKTHNEIKFALDLGCHINADSVLELDRIERLITDDGNQTNSTIGIRINPQVGTGAISDTSVAGEYSKFGVPIKENRALLIEKLEKYSWLTCVHVHIGSQGCSVDMLSNGIQTIMGLVKEVNSNIDRNGDGVKISTIDIGGGLPVSYHKDSEVISLSEYVDELRNTSEELFNGSFKLITEFGRYTHANSAWVVSKVEYVKREPGVNTAMIHVGADLFLRKCYRPNDWHHDILVLDTYGNIKKGTDETPYVIAGPLCFSGDVIAKDILLPIICEGDYIVIKDVGAYTLSMWSRYNSRQIPKVAGYISDGGEFTVLREREKISGIINFWR